MTGDQFLSNVNSDNVSINRFHLVPLNNTKPIHKISSYFANKNIVFHELRHLQINYVINM